MQDFEHHVNGKIYVGPHKWIVCLLGDDVYAVNQFRLNNRDRLVRSQNVSISIMTLSAEPKSKDYHSKDYHELSSLTKEGLFVNVTSKEENDRVVERFSSSMAVYHSDKRMFVREYFGTF